MRRGNRKPTSPGEILFEEFMKPLQLTQKELATHLDCDIKVVNRIINERTSVTAEMALKLASTFSTSAEFWLNAQQANDIYAATQRLKRVPKPLIRTPVERQV
jgi:addiction module HigA family antidote